MRGKEKRKNLFLEKPPGPTVGTEEPEDTTLTGGIAEWLSVNPQKHKMGSLTKTGCQDVKQKPTSKTWHYIKRRLKLNKKTLQMNSELCLPDKAKTEIRTLEFHCDRRESSGNPGEAVRMEK